MCYNKPNYVFCLIENQNGGIYMSRIVVDQYGKGDFTKIQDAFDAAAKAEGHVEIFICNGIYEEKLLLERNDVEIIGEDSFNTVITYNDYAKKILPDGNPYGTFRTATLRLVGNDITMKNITVVNSSGNGRDYGQAIALYTDGDRMKFYDCRLIGHQDTLFMAPKTEGPANKEHELTSEPSPIDARIYWKDCFIEGDVDFIFGGATAYFEECEIFSHYVITEDDKKYQGLVKGYATAPCTWRGQKYGFVFDRCAFTGDCPKNTVYLGRPWRIQAKTVLLECYVGEHIKKEGWHDWDKPQAHGVTYYAEYGCDYECEVDRPDWVYTLTEEEAKEYTKKNILWEGFCEE